MWWKKGVVKRPIISFTAVWKIIYKRTSYAGQFSLIMFNNQSESISTWNSNDGIPGNITPWTQYYNESLDTLWDSHEVFETFKRDLITLNQPNTIVLICLYVPVFLTAIIGNLTVLFVIIPNRRMWSVTNNFLLNLAIADLLGKLLNLYRVTKICI